MFDEPLQRLARVAADWRLALSEVQIRQFEAYLELLIRRNAEFNLTAVSTPDLIVTRHFLDSLRCALSWGDAPDSLADIGSGAGFPGIPLAILRPEMRVTLVETIGKKAAFLHEVADLLTLPFVSVLTVRAEQLGRDVSHREQYAVVTARAVAELRVLAEYCLPLCRIGGRMLAPKSADSAAEVQAALAVVARLGGNQPEVEVVEIPGEPLRSLIVVQKMNPTPPAYPRAVGVPARRPLA